MGLSHKLNTESVLLRGTSTTWEFKPEIIIILWATYYVKFELMLPGVVSSLPPGSWEEETKRIALALPEFLPYGLSYDQFSVMYSAFGSKVIRCKKCWQNIWNSLCTKTYETNLAVFEHPAKFGFLNSFTELLKNKKQKGVMVPILSELRYLRQRHNSLRNGSRRVCRYIGFYSRDICFNVRHKIQYITKHLVKLRGRNGFNLNEMKHKCVNQLTFDF